jgi:O-acetyl-ADP-ribose deacetylase
MTIRFADTLVVLVQGDITQIAADAIVNAANAHLAGGGGVDGAIHDAGGPSIMKECLVIGGCPTGSAVHTGAGRLAARHVIHAVAPRWMGGTANEAALLGGAYRTALQLADTLGDHTVAFPSLGTGAYGYPIEPAAEIALRTLRQHSFAGTKITTVTFVLFSAPDLDIYESALAEQLEVSSQGDSPDIRSGHT